MAKAKIQFSSKALDNANVQASNNYTLSSVKSSWTWILLIATTLFFAMAIFWGIYGRINESVSGVAITMLSKGSRPIVATGSGTVSHINIQIGSSVEAEQIVGQIFNAENFFSVQRLESDYFLLKSQIEILSTGTDDITEKLVEADAKRSKFLEHLSAEHNKAKGRADEVSEIYLDLLEQGAESKISYYQSLSQQFDVEASMISTLLDHLSNETNTHNTLWERQQKILSLQQQLDAKEHELNLAKQLYTDAYWIRSSFDGTIREVFKENGAFVQAGEKIALVDSDREDGIYLLAYVPVSEGKKIKNGMGAFFSPMSLPSSEFGFLRCVVREISPLPINVDSIQAELMNTSLTEMIASKNAMLRVVLELIPDSTCVSKYSWTSKSEIPMEITNGMLGEILVNTGYRPPASYIIPALRKFIKGDSLKEKKSQEESK